MAELHPVAIVADYDGLVMALRQRVVELDISLEILDEVSGLTPRYCSKLLSPNRIKTLGPMSLMAILGTLGLKLALVSDDEGLAKLRHRLPKRGAGGPRIKPLPLAHSAST